MSGKNLINTDAIAFMEKLTAHICNECGQPIVTNDCYFVALSKQTNGKLPDMYFHIACYESSENHIREREAFEDYLERVSS